MREIKFRESDKSLNVGDTIKCASQDDMLNYMAELSKAGIETDFDFSEPNKLVVVKYESVKA